jgi:ribulose-5-phosphate 4-epimerase/fuculose-1-phosphate aldolase
VVALSAVGRQILPVFGAYDPTGLRVYEAGISEYESSVTVHTLEEGNAVADAMGETDVCIMRQHGIVVAGTSVESALKATLAIHELSRLNWLAAAVGEPRAIRDEDRRIFDERSRRGGKAPKREDGKSAYWHYLERRANSGANAIDEVLVTLRNQSES